jgi:hypothetical protein
MPYRSKHETRNTRVAEVLAYPGQTTTQTLNPERSVSASPFFDNLAIQPSDTSTCGALPDDLFWRAVYHGLRKADGGGLNSWTNSLPCGRTLDELSDELFAQNAIQYKLDELDDVSARICFNLVSADEQQRPPTD